MLDEFLNDLLKRHAERLQVLREKLESTDGGDKHDLTRGGIRALSEFLVDINTLIQDYRKPKSTGELGSEPLDFVPRGYGRLGSGRAGRVS